MESLSGVVRFLASHEGGRRSGPPRAARYAATAVRALPQGAASPEGWPWTAGQFSIVIDFSAPPTVTGVRAEISPLVPGSPGSDALAPGARLVVLEGSTVVAEATIDPD